MLEGNDSQLENNSFTFFGPVGMVFYEEGTMFDNNSIKIVLTIYLGIAMILSLVGNICTCAVIARNRSMRTPTNCYLFNLAITDIITACFVPLEIYIIWIPEFYPLGEVGCQIHFMLWDFINNCSLLIITAFTIERYLVVSRPFLRSKLSLNSRVFKIVAIIWLISAAFSVPDIYFVDLLERKKYVFCYFTVSDPLSIVITIDIFLFFVVPMSIIVVLYALIIIDLKSAKKKIRTSPMTLQHNKDRAVKMLAAVAASFFFFWSPYSILRAFMVLARFGIGRDENYNVWKIINFLCYNAYLSPVANPILYSLMSRKFRQAFKNLLKRRSPIDKRMKTTTISLSISRHSSEHFNIQNLTKIKLHNT